MENWKDGVRERLARGISGMTHLTESERAALLEAEVDAVVTATEAGLPLGAAPETETKAADSEEFESPETPAPRRIPRPGKGPGRAW